MGYLARAQWSRDPWTRQVRFCFVGPCNKGCRITKGAFACDEFFQAAENLAWNIWKFFSRHYSIYFWSGNYRSDAEQGYGWCHRCCISQFEMESRNHVHSWSIQSHYTSFWISTAWVSYTYCNCGVLTWSQWLGISGHQDHIIVHVIWTVLLKIISVKKFNSMGSNSFVIQKIFLGNIWMSYHQKLNKNGQQQWAKLIRSESEASYMST